MILKNPQFLVKLHKKMDVKLKILTATIFLILITSTTAKQDLNFTVRNSKGLCFYQTDVDCQTCDNQTFTLNGSVDHLIHLGAQKPYGNCNNYTTTNSTEIISDYMTVDFLWEIAILGILLALFLRWTNFRRIG